LPITERVSAQRRISRSGTQIQTIWAEIASLPVLKTFAPTLRASVCALRREPDAALATSSVTGYPASRNESASAVPRLPAPTIARLGFFGRLCGIAEEYQCTQPSENTTPALALLPIPICFVALAYIVAMPTIRSPKTARSQSARKSSSKTKRSSKASSQGRKTARILSRRLVYSGPAFWVTSDRIQEPSGVRVLREVVRHSGSVVILATLERSRETFVLLERQYRHAADSYLWELPAGRIDKGEKALPAAKRELLEETGYTAKSWKQILRFFASPGFVAEPMTVFWARELKAGPAQPEADEVIEQHLVPLSKAVKMVLDGTIRDAKTISSVLWLALNKKGTKGL
jgi:ADP-ribose pyrophosphatase